MANDEIPTYFANLPEYDDEYGAEVMRRIDDYYLHLTGDPQYERMRRVYWSYNGHASNSSKADSSRVRRGGRKGELALIKVNHVRNLIQHMLTLTTAQRPAAQPIAANSDKKSHMQVTLAHGLLDYYLREKRVERVLRMAAEFAVAFGEGFTRTEWDSTAGKEHDADPVSGTILYEGDLSFREFTPLDVPRDLTLTSFDDRVWLATREFIPKYQLVAKYAAKDPELAKDILSLASRNETHPIFEMRRLPSDKSDRVPVYTFYHDRTPDCPDGRKTVICSAKVILFDGPMNTKTIPVHRIRPSDLIGTPHGYTVTFDLLAIQEVIDALYSAVATNQSTFGVQNIAIPKGTGADFIRLAGGLNLIKYDPALGKPEPINLTYTPGEIFGFIRQLEEVMETLSGINSTVRGNPEASLKSGSALALVQSQAIQFSSGLQQSYAQHVEDVFTMAFDLLKRNAKTKRVALIVGKYNHHMLKEFTSDDLKDIERVVVDSGSALSKTASGRIQIAQDLLQNQLIKTPEEYLSVINTGRLEPLTESQNRELINIRAENEKLAQGARVRALAIDDHRLHVLEHKTVLDNPDAREPTPENEALQVNTTQHIMEHINFLKTVDPALLTVLGQQSLQQAMLPTEQAAGGTPPKQPNIGIPPDAQLPQLAPEQPAPVMPKNPATGQPWNPTDGGDMLAGAVAANVAPSGISQTE